MDEPAPTILTEPQNASTALCHPTLDRPLSVRECARLQTFPDSWAFCGRGAEQYRLIGNAVPVKLGEVIGKQVRLILEGRALGLRGRDLAADSGIDPAEESCIVQTTLSVSDKRLSRFGESLDEVWNQRLFDY